MKDDKKNVVVLMLFIIQKRVTAFQLEMLSLFFVVYITDKIAVSS